MPAQDCRDLPQVLLWYVDYPLALCLALPSGWADRLPAALFSLPRLSRTGAGDRAVRFEVVSDQSINFPKNERVNYEVLAQGEGWEVWGGGVRGSHPAHLISPPPLPHLAPLP